MALSTLNPNHFFFSKSYIPAPHELGKKGKNVSEEFFEDEFLQGLPPKKITKCSKKMNNSFTSNSTQAAAYEEEDPDSINSTSHTPGSIKGQGTIDKFQSHGEAQEGNGKNFGT